MKCHRPETWPESCIRSHMKFPMFHHIRVTSKLWENEQNETNVLYGIFWFYVFEVALFVAIGEQFTWSVANWTDRSYFEVVLFVAIGEQFTWNVANWTDRSYFKVALFVAICLMKCQRMKVVIASNSWCNWMKSL